MTDPSRDRGFTEDPDAKAKPGRRSAAPTPRWVKVFGIIAVALVLIFVFNHLAGGGMGGHTP